MDLRTARGLLLLLSVPGVGAKTALDVAAAFPTFDKLTAASEVDLQSTVGTRAAKAEWDQAVAPDDRTLELAISIYDDGYPKRLRGLDNPPPVLWVRGELPPGLDVAGAVVGTRSPDGWGRRVAAAAAQALVGAGATVVSGLALGIDTVAHQAALDAEGHTVAVLGSGVDNVTPRENRELADSILEAGGAIVAEVPPATSPDRGSLVARNRLQSGLSRLTVIAQCGIPSGTLHTARFTLLQQRRLIVPQPTGQHADTATSAGNIALAASPPDPAVVRATGPLARELATRARLADDTPEDGPALAAAIETGLAGEPPQPVQTTLL